jgi:predicted metalloprotease with PDZ domain
MPEPHSHLFRVDVELDDAAGPVRLVMPSWTPGSYLMREFPRNVQEFAAADGAGTPLRWEKTDKNTWQVSAPAGGRLFASYAVYANEITVRTSHLDASHAYVNGASVFMYAEGRERGPLEVRIDAPEGWRTTTALPQRDGEPVFTAADYDELVDSPFEIGTHALFEWEMDGLPHRLAVWGRGNLDGERLVADTKKIITAEKHLFGSLPYPGYTFILHLTPGGYGGLEHKNSTSLLADRWAFRGNEYEGFLGLVAHEFFHLWNGKRIRPAVLGPFDYTRENYTRDLWVVEGFTTYYTDLMLRRAGLITVNRYLEKLGEVISRFQALPGRAVQTLADSSFDTWIKFYRPDAHTPSAQISYYQKGGLVALLLDLKIRASTAGERSLDDVLRLLWERFGARDAGFPEGGVERVASEVCGTNLSEFFDRALRTTEELEYGDLLAAAGLQLKTPENKETKDQKSDADSDATGDAVEPGATAVSADAPLGMRLRGEGARTVVSNVLAGTAAHRAGVNNGDELLALDGLRVAQDSLTARVRERKPGDRITLTLFRRDELLTLEVEVEAATPKLRVTPVADPTAEQTALLQGWLRAVV